MSTQKIVFEKLSSINVKLGMLDDIKDANNKLEAAWKEGQSVRSNALKEAKMKVDSEIKKMVDIRVETFKLISEFESRAKDLGLDGSNLPQVKEGKKSLEIMDVRIKELSKGFDQSLM